MRKLRTQTFFVLTDNELEAIVSETLKIDGWCFAAEEEAGNDSQHTFNISESDATEESKKDIAATLKKLRAGNYESLYTQDVLTELARRKVIPFGDYMITISY